MSLLGFEQTRTRLVCTLTTRLLLAERLAAAQQARQLREEASAEARRERDQLLEQARSEARAELERARGEAARLAARSVGFSQACRARRAEELALVVREACRRLLRAEIQAQPDAVARLCRELLEQRLLEHPVRLLVHPEDVGPVMEMLRAHGGEQLRVEARPELTRGGCVLCGDDGDIDASLELQLENLLSAVREGWLEDLGVA